MFVAYAFQLAIIALISLTITFYWLIRALKFLATKFPALKRAIPQGLKFNRQWTKSSRLRPAHVTSLIEFQRAQAYFMIAVQIACLIALHYPGQLESTSWQQLHNNISLLFDLALGGSGPVVLALLSLKSIESRGTYTLLLSTCSVALSIATGVFSMTRHIDPDLHINYQGVGVPACGLRTAPIKYCYSQNSYGWIYMPRSKDLAILLPFSLVQLGLIVEKVWCTVWLCRHRDLSAIARKGYRIRYFALPDSIDQTTDRDQRMNARRRNNPAPAIQGQAARGRLEILKPWHYQFIQVVLCFPMYYIFSQYQALVSNDLEGSGNWSLGQVMSVTVWIPVLLEYFWMLICKDY